MALPFQASIWVTSSFVAFHRWIDAPEEVKFLRDYHRHVFHVRLEVEVKHADRQVEFFILQKQLNNLLALYAEHSKFDWSCERFASEIRSHMSTNYIVVSVTVSEDGENGATLQSCVPVCPS